jgi:hypothetical protein
MATYPPVRRKVRQAVSAVLTVHADLLRRRVAERTLTGHLARILGPSFPDWDVDPEYNKRTRHYGGQERTDPKRVGRDPRILVPDVIIHRRGEPSNLLTIEVKRLSDSRGP